MIVWFDNLSKMRKINVDKEIVRKIQIVLGSLFTLGQNRWGWKPPHFFQMQYSLLDGRTVPI